ncbi:Proteinase inhibitor I25, cystatin, conserved region [Trema orientale]|uniref:Proteinase inhibitor I25, cystatin, conserved region n=1 Tax=Trema orientale TaxID=63057 RepID=A0A2P5F0W6_TREOI|nr:Proteinase inhibitor I25, cystatin, conserved region [Trema orientale]
MDTGSLSKSIYNNFEESTGNAQVTSYAHDSKKTMDMGGLWKSGFYYSEGSIGKAKFDSEARESKKKGCLADVWRQRLLDAPSGMFVPVDISSKYTQDAARSAVEEYNKDQLEAIELKRVVKSYMSIMRGHFCLLTLEATDGRFYKARIYMNPKGPNELEYFTLAKDYPMPVQDME